MLHKSMLYNSKREQILTSIYQFNIRSPCLNSNKIHIELSPRKYTINCL